MQKWEYLVITLGHDSRGNKLVLAVNGEFFGDKRLDPPTLHKYLEELGKQGWELIGMQEAWLYFKRPIENEMPRNMDGF